MISYFGTVNKADSRRFFCLCFVFLQSKKKKEKKKKKKKKKKEKKKKRKREEDFYNFHDHLLLSSIEADEDKEARN